MDKEKRDKYYLLLERLIDVINDMDSFDREKYVQVIKEASELFHISKGVSEFYKTVSDERIGNGEILCDQDDGKDDVLELEKRFVTPSKAVVKGKIYRTKETPPFTEEEKEKIDVMFRSILSFIARMRLQRLLEEFAFNDGTGYPNVRAYFRYIGQLNVTKGLYGYTFGSFNLKHFSVVNREIGRQMGDVVFASFYKLISEVVSPEGIVCRLGGDNFVLAFKNEDTNAVIDVLSGVPVPYDESGKNRVEVSATAGFFKVYEGYTIQTPEDILERVMPAAQAAKVSDSEQILFYDERMFKEKGHMMAVQRLFTAALENSEFKVFYQPKVDVNTGRLVGAEALCRWFRDGKIVPPMDFIPILEKNMDICRLDFHMLDMVCADLRRWIDSGKEPVRISVNLSRKHLMDVDLLSHIMEVVDKHQVPHHYIEIELTETTTDVEFKDLKRVVNGLQLQGICTAVDDFGVGYSSLNLIREIPWNILKIDRCFVPEDGKNQYSTTSLMYKHVVAMAHDIGLECVTEGVETKEQVEILRQCQCDVAQGFFFDRPLPVEEFEERMARGKYEI